MPSLHDNLEQWDEQYSWDARGDEWSASWGGTENLWRGTLEPRLHDLLRGGTILELGPGFGRWTQYLKDVADNLLIVDLSERCIESCRERFADSENITFHVNDGRSLDMIPDDSIDLVFSFDSLVHAEADVLAAYVGQLARKFTPEGIGFIHHSNMGAYRRHARLARRVPERLRPGLVRSGALVNVYAWRAESVTAEGFERICADAGLACVGQEKINWETGSQLIDCLSMFCRPTASWSRPNARVDNPDFMREAASSARRAALYTSWANGTAPANPR